MAPGLFCVWSRTDPDEVATINADETFSDAVTKLPGVGLGTQVQVMKQQVMDSSFNHDIPFLTFYELDDVEYRNNATFKQVEAACQSRGEGACKPRIYEQVFRKDVEGCEDSENRSLP